MHLQLLKGIRTKIIIKEYGNSHKSPAKVHIKYETREWS